MATGTDYRQNQRVLMLAGLLCSKHCKLAGSRAALRQQLHCTALRQPTGYTEGGVKQAAALSTTVVFALLCTPPA